MADKGLNCVVAVAVVASVFMYYHWHWDQNNGADWNLNEILPTISIWERKYPLGLKTSVLDRDVVAQFYVKRLEAILMPHLFALFIFVVCIYTKLSTAIFCDWSPILETQNHVTFNMHICYWLEPMCKKTVISYVQYPVVKTHFMLLSWLHDRQLWVEDWSEETCNDTIH